MFKYLPTLVLCLITAIPMTGCHHGMQRQAGCTDACYRCDSATGMVSPQPEVPVQQIPRFLAPPKQPQSLPADQPPQEPATPPKAKDGFLPPVKGPDEADPAAPSADYFPRATSTSK